MRHDISPPADRLSSLADVVRISGVGVTIVGLLVALPGLAPRLAELLRLNVGRRPAPLAPEPGDVAVLSDHEIVPPEGLDAEQGLAWTAQHLESLRQRVSLVERETTVPDEGQREAVRELEAALARQIERVRRALEGRQRAEGAGAGFAVAATGIAFVGLHPELARLPWWLGSVLVVGVVFWALWTLAETLLAVPAAPPAEPDDEF